MFPSVERYRQLPAAAAAVLHAALIIDTTATSDLAVALGIPVAEVDRRLATLAAQGWVEPAPDAGMRWRDAAYMWMRYDAPTRLDPSALHGDDTVVAARYLDHHLTALTHPDREHAARWLAAQRATLLVAINAGVRNGLTEKVIAAAKAAWALVDSPVDRDWHTALANASEPAACEDRERLELVRHSADHALRAGDLETAEHQYCQAAELAFALDDHTAAAGALTALNRVLRGSDQAGRAADVLLELADLHLRTDDLFANAVTLTELGEVVLDGGRPRLARIYLTEAITTLDQDPGNNQDLLALAHELHGHALWAQGMTTRARRAFRSAATYVDDANTVSRERLDALVYRKRPRRRRTSPPPTIPDPTPRFPARPAPSGGML